MKKGWAVLLLLLLLGGGVRGASEPQLWKFNHERVEVRWCGTALGGELTGYAFVYPEGQNAAFQWLVLDYQGVDGLGCALWGTEWDAGLGKYWMTALHLSDGNGVIPVEEGPWSAWFVGIPGVFSGD